MIIRVDKYSTFGIKKAITKSVQYLPKLLINNNLIPATIKIGDAFQYLGRYFDFSMSNNNHKTELATLVNELMTDIDSKPLHPRNKLLVYSRYVLSKLSWHFTIATLSKTWVIENIDPVVNQYIRKWLEIPISGTLSTVFITCNTFGQSIYPPSVKFIQCQTVLRKALKLSPNQSINELWKSTNTHTNIQYDFYSSTKEVLKDFRSEHENKLKNQLTCQGSFFSNVTSSPCRILTKCSLLLNQNFRKTFITLLYAISITLFRHVRTLADGDCLQVQNAPFVSAQNHYCTSSLDVSVISID